MQCFDVTWSYRATGGSPSLMYAAVFRRYRQVDSGPKTDQRELAQLRELGVGEGNYNDSQTTQTAEDCPPTAGVEYWYEVEAKFNGGFAGSPKRVAGSTSDASPQPPTGLDYDPPTAATPTGTLSWDEPTVGPLTGGLAITGYYVQYRFDDGEWADGRHTGTDNSYTDHNWKRHGVKLDFRVQIRTSFNGSAPLDSAWTTHTAISSRTSNDAAKLVVRAYQPVLQLDAAGFQSRHLEWDAPAGDVLGYFILRREVSEMDAPFVPHVTGHTGTSFSETSGQVMEGTAYEYRVQAYNLASGGNVPSDIVQLDFVGTPGAAVSTDPPADTQVNLSNFLRSSFTSTGPSVLAPGSVHEFTVTRTAGGWTFGGDRHGLAFDAGRDHWARWIAADDFGACVDVLFCVMRQADADFSYHPTDGVPSRWLTLQRGGNISEGFGAVAMDSFRIYVPRELQVPGSFTFGFAQIPESGSPTWLDPPRETHRSLEIRPVVLIGPTALTGTFLSDNRLQLNWAAAAGDYLGFRVQRRDAAATDQAYQAVCCNIAPSARFLLDVLPASGQPGAATAYEYRVGTYFDDGREVWFQKTLRVDVAGQTTEVDSVPRFPVVDHGRRFTLAAGAAATQPLPSATGGDAPLTYSMSDLSTSQLQFDPVAHGLSGTPVVGTFFGTLHVRDANGDTDSLRFSVVVGSPPGMPSLTVMADPSAYQIALTWTEPSGTSSGEVTGYRIEHSSSGEDGSWLVLVGDTGPMVTEWVHSNLRNQQRVYYRVAAINAAGVGTFSDRMDAMTIAAATRPSAPTMLTATPGPSRVTLTWQPPVSDGGQRILGYCVQVAPVENPSVIAKNGRSAERTVLAAYLPATARTYLHRDYTQAEEYPDQSTLTYWRRSYLPAGIPLYYRVGAINSQNEGYITKGLSASNDLRTCNERTEHVLGALRPIPDHATDFAVVRAIPGEPAAPSVPTNFAVTRGAYQLHLQWLPPDDDGGDPVSGYRIQHSTTGDRDSWDVLVAHTHSDRTEYIHAGLGRGTTGYYRVAAINTGGVGEFTNERFATTSNAQTPSPPNLEAVRGAERITLNWRAPAASGSGAVSGYSLQISAVGPGGPWGNSIAAGGADVTTYTHTGLNAGERRYYRLAAQNRHGAGPWSRVVSERTVQGSEPRCPPAFVRHNYVGSSRALSLTDGYPNDDYCQPVPTHSILFVQHTYDRWAPDPDWQETQVSRQGVTFDDQLPWTITIPPTPPGGRITLRMGYDVNSARGAWRVVTGLRNVPLDGTGNTNSPPLAPIGLAAEALDSAIDLSWTAPHPGTDPIEYYKLEHTTDAMVTEETVWVGPLTLDRYLTRYAFAGTPDTQYHFRLAAGNAARGDGPWATVTATTSAAVGSQPDPPYDLNATPATAGTIALTWRAPLLDHGVTVTAFRIEQSADGSADSWSTLHTTTDATARSHEHTGLTVGQQVFYRIFSVAVQDSVASRTVNAAAPGTVAGAPTQLTAIGGRYANHLEWTAPAMTGGTPIQSYRVQYRDRRNAEWENLVAATGGRATGFIDRVAPNRVQREYQVAAITAGRSGTYSTTVIATRSVDRPNPPTRVTGAVHGEDVEVQWLAPMHAGPGRRVIGYRVDRLRTGDSQWHTVAQDTRTDRTSFLDREVSLNSRYSYRVFAFNRHDPGMSLASDPSDAVHVVADWKLPPTTVWVEFGLHRNTIRWSRVDGGGGVTVNGYRIQHAVSADADTAGWADLHTAESRYVRSYTHSGLQGQQAEHYYRIASVTSEGDSRYSVVVGGPVHDSVTFLDFNENDQVDRDDLRVLYFGFAFRELLGDGNGRGFADMRRALLSGRGVSEGGTAIGRSISDAEIREYLAVAHGIARSIDAAEFDVNGDGVVTDDDALILYYASELNAELGDGQTGGTVNFRRTFLRPLAFSDNPTDAELQMLLIEANRLLGN